MKSDNRFAPASPSEDVVFGAQRPGYSSKNVGAKVVAEWITFMKAQGIQRVCCLLGPGQLDYYSSDLLETYRAEFGIENVVSAPLEDYHLCEAATLENVILPFLEAADLAKSPVVVHCSGGSGRTGHVLAAWLVRRKGLTFDEALTTLHSLLRNPEEAVQMGNATQQQLQALVSGTQA